MPLDVPLRQEGGRRTRVRSSLLVASRSERYSGLPALRVVW